MDDEKVGTNIAERRRSLGISQKDFSEKLKFSQSYISEIETGKVDPPERTKSLIESFLAEGEKARQGIKDAEIKEMGNKSPEVENMNDLINKAKIVLRQPDDNQYRKALIENIKAFFLAVASDPPNSGPEDPG